VDICPNKTSGVLAEYETAGLVGICRRGARQKDDLNPLNNGLTLGTLTFSIVDTGCRNEIWVASGENESFLLARENQRRTVFDTPINAKSHWVHGHGLLRDGGSGFLRPRGT
jgi:hypothetical protein